jgi:hypothetical protein
MTFTSQNLLVAFVAVISVRVIAEQDEAIWANANLFNNCDYDVWLWPTEGLSTGQTEKSQCAVQVQAHGIYSEPLRHPWGVEDDKPKEMGVSMKISKSTSQEAITQFEYTIAQAENGTYVDISLIDCVDSTRTDAKNCPGHEGGLRITAPSEPSCNWYCRPGEYCPSQAYYEPQPNFEPNSRCERGDINFVLCSG